MAETMNAAAIRSEWVGSVVDERFLLLKWLGGSAGAGVFLTELNKPAKKAIIKLIPADSEDAEIRMAAWPAAANLSHKNLIEVFASGRCEIDSVPLLYVVTEFADEVLAEIILERALTPEEAREMLGPALDALAYLHGKGFIHGRLKPSNIMAVGDRLKLSTDGLLLTGAIGKSSLERSVYDAPETVRGRIRPATDVWSLGATLVEVLTQRQPAWDSATSEAPAVPSSVPEPFASIARDCLRAEPAQRCTIDEIKARLTPAAVGRVPEGQGKTPAAKRHAGVWLAVAAIVLAVIGIWNVFSHRTQSPSADQEAENAPAAAAAPAPVQTPTETQAPAAISAAVRAAPQKATPAAPAKPALAAGSAPTPVETATAPRQVETQTQAPQSSAPGGATENGEAAQQVQPDVAPKALRTITGTVKVSVRLTVDADGNVTDATLDTAGPSQYFANKALDAAKQWKFKPAQGDGRPTQSVWLLHFQFRQSGITETVASGQ